MSYGELRERAEAAEAKLARAKEVLRVCDNALGLLGLICMDGPSEEQTCGECSACHGVAAVVLIHAYFDGAPRGGEESTK